MSDAQVREVLNAYHERSRREREEQRQLAHLPEEDWRDRMMLSVGPDTGQLIDILARSLAQPVILELGTSFGYSTIWLAQAARASGGRVISVDLAAHKVEHARTMATRAGLAAYVDFRIGDAVELVRDLNDRIDFVLLDLWKDVYEAALDAFYPRLNRGALIVADNMICPGGENARRYRDAVAARPGISSVLLPVGTGLEVSRYEP